MARPQAAAPAPPEAASGRPRAAAAPVPPRLRETGDSVRYLVKNLRPGDYKFYVFANVGGEGGLNARADAGDHLGYYVQDATAPALTAGQGANYALMEEERAAGINYPAGTLTSTLSCAAVPGPGTITVPGNVLQSQSTEALCGQLGQSCCDSVVDDSQRCQDLATELSRRGDDGSPNAFVCGSRSADACISLRLP